MSGDVAPKLCRRTQSLCSRTRPTTFDAVRPRPDLGDARIFVLLPVDEAGRLVEHVLEHRADDDVEDEGGRFLIVVVLKVIRVGGVYLVCDDPLLHFLSRMPKDDSSEAQLDDIRVYMDDNGFITFHHVRGRRQDGFLKEVKARSFVDDSKVPRTRSIVPQPDRCSKRPLLRRARLARLSRAPFETVLIAPTALMSCDDPSDDCKMRM